MAEIRDDDKQDFWDWTFEQSGTNPLGWQHSAHDLLEAADAVKARVLISLVYVLLRRVLQFLIPLDRSRDFKELEIVVEGCRKSDLARLTGCA